jgi:hypothetical protein
VPSFKAACASPAAKRVTMDIVEISKKSGFGPICNYLVSMPLLRVGLFAGFFTITDTEATLYRFNL